MAVTVLKKGSLALAGLLLVAQAQATELLNSSYDVSRELFAALNPAFEQQWAKDNNGDKLTIKQSHAGSSKQALAILQGLKADVVTYNQVTDVQILHDKGKLIPADWQSRLPNNSSPFYSTMGFLVRKGNPKNIHDWSDLVRSDVKLIFPNPKTSGNARYTYLAAWGAADKADGNDKAKTEQFMTQFLKNVEVFDTGGRGATTTFAERGLGDVLISFESEVNNIRKQYEAQGFEVVIPKTNILAEFPVAWVDKNVQANGTEKAAKAYLNYLYSPQAQTIITDFSRELNNAWQQLRELLTTFRLTLNHANLPAALQESLDALQSQTQAKLHLDCRLSSLALDAQKQVHLLQIVREAVLNAIKHAQASEITVSCVTAADGTHSVSIRDNGIGIGEASEPPGHYGLNIMRERAQRLGGVLHFSQPQNGGTLVSVTFPAPTPITGK